ncbi:MAG: Stk1 family PASTA domain-containing Ser/Thr kinase [Sulfobacillus benefaciens]|uniref:non-specific serine/threonine protein kinase n=1 Tax=Sulfobacillus benefaciens TaxID=453960 RepID=A0A2T2XJL9_9FIRM|nr:MAG: Stk1 family PASTA domain-containing Ser/Thr kinase [Sulfobacillus benefaciens]
MVGKVLGGRYEVLERIGTGGMSLVYRARDLTLNRLVAVKILKHQWAGDDEVVRRFDQEARSAASLVNRHIVQVYDVGREEPDIHYMIMELVVGEPLRSKIDREAPLPIMEALDIVDQVAAGLEAAHSKKVVHRDIKPQNILLAEDGTAKVTDFGIAYAATSGTLVNTGSMLGTVQYLSPEQARGKAVGPQSDLYSLGVVLFEMLTGRLPFEGESAIGVAIKHLQDDAPKVQSLRPDIPTEVSQIVERSLAKDPAERYRTAQAFRNDVARVLSPGTAPAIIESQEAPAKSRSVVAEGGKTTKSHEKKKIPRWVPWTVAVVLLLLLAGGSYYALNRWLNVPSVAVPNVKGQSLVSAKVHLQGVRLHVQVVGKTPSSHLPKNFVVNEIPDPGTIVKQGQFVQLVLSSGPEQVTVPNLKGQDIFLAQQELKTELLNIKVHHVNNQQPQGLVVRQSPSAGTLLAQGGTVTVWVSNGPSVSSQTMPYLEGLTVSQAASELIGLNLAVGTPTETYSTQPANTIIDQSPEPYTPIGNATQVNVTISEGPSPQSANLPKNINPITWQIPSTAPPKSLLKVVVTDSADNQEVFYQLVNPGKVVSFTVVWYGTTGQLEPYLNGQPQAPTALTSNSGNSAPPSPPGNGT